MVLGGLGRVSGHYEDDVGGERGGRREAHLLSGLDGADERGYEPLRIDLRVRAFFSRTLSSCVGRSVGLSMKG